MARTSATSSPAAAPAPLTPLALRWPAAAARGTAAADAGWHWHAGLGRNAALWLIFARQLAARAAGDTGSLAVVWLPTPEDVETAATDLNAWQSACEPEIAVHLFPPWDVLPTESPTPDSEALTGRSNVLKDIHEGRLNTAGILLTSSQALLQPCPLAAQMTAGERVLRKGDAGDPIELIRWLADKGYQRVTKTFAHGEAALRGQILDVYPWVRAMATFDRDTAVRILFEFDRIEEIHAFDPRTQRSLGEVQQIRLQDMSAQLLAQPFDPRRPELRTTLWTHLPASAELHWIDPDRGLEAARLYLESQRTVEELATLAAGGAPAGRGMAFLPADLLDAVRHRSRAVYAPLAPPAPDSALPGAQASAATGDLDNSIDNAAAWIARHWTAAAAVQEWRTTDLQRLQGGGVAKLRDLLVESPLPRGVTGDVVVWAETVGDREQIKQELTALWPAGSADLARHCVFLVGVQSQSFEIRGGSDSDAAVSAADGGRRLVFVSQEHLHGKRHLRKTDTRKSSAGKRLFDFLELNLGDLVVHTLHGICRYMGLTRMERNGKLEDYLVLLFAEDVKMYVPGAHIDLVQKYVGKGGDAGRSTAEAAVQLSRLGGRIWSTRKARAEKALKDIAEDLLAVQAARRQSVGIVHPPESDLTRAFDQSFPYTETPDQLASLIDIKQDLERPYPMDRLLCGDVGFGKTEVAVRAAFKAVCGGRQVAVLVPTTILAEQHRKTFSDRMAATAVRVEALSRFRGTQEVKQILEATRLGRVDVLIGTHRLLQKDVRFANLGLAIIDEEQRFGVVHKEFFKRLRATVDTLTLTATPIPRTLHMSLMGLRDISSLSQPPADRKAVATKICKWDPNQIRRAVLREINRGGQAFFIHNRVHSLYAVKKRLEAILPEVRIGVGHGKMDEQELARVMFEFINGRIDLLLATTIIESGLDIPNANTLFVDRADKFGLADLHQLRGRVGRSERKAYAYFLIDDHTPPNARGWERLKAIEEFDGLGAGFNLAMRDLEIRGAGNILGAEQSGNIADIGYELYTRILEKVVRTAKGEEALDPVEITVDLRLNASFPEGYLADDEEALETYRSLSLCRTVTEADEVLAELIDCSGPAPIEVCRVFCQAHLRILSQQARVPYVGIVEKRLQVRGAGWKFDLLQRALADRFRDVRVLDDETVTLPIPGEIEENPYDPHRQPWRSGRARDRHRHLAGRSAQEAAGQPAPTPALTWTSRLNPRAPATWPLPWQPLTAQEAQLWELCEAVLTAMGKFRSELIQQDPARFLAPNVARHSGDNAQAVDHLAHPTPAVQTHLDPATGPADDNATESPTPPSPAATAATTSAPAPNRAPPAGDSPSQVWPVDDDDFAPRRAPKAKKSARPPAAPGKYVPPPPPSPSALAAETLMKKSNQKLKRGRNPS